MGRLVQLNQLYKDKDYRDLGQRQLEELQKGLRSILPNEVQSSEDAVVFLELLSKFRKAVAENDRFHGENYPQLLNSILSVGEDGLYSNDLRFLFELIQNVDDCDYPSADDCRLDMRFDFNGNTIVLTYNENGFTPFNVFAITGIAEAAKNITTEKQEIGEKGIGFKSVFGVAEKVLIESGWFSFELRKAQFTIPVIHEKFGFHSGTRMTLFVSGSVQYIYEKLSKQYANNDAIFSRNPLLFLNKLTSLKLYYDNWRSMEFQVDRGISGSLSKKQIDRDFIIAVDIHNHSKQGMDTNISNCIECTRYTYPVTFSKDACTARYGANTKVGQEKGKTMILQIVMPNPEYISTVGKGALYSFLPTQIRLNIPMVCHVPFKLDASREFVDPQGENQWFKEASSFLAQFIEEVFIDWRKKAREEMILYLPGKNESIFAENNGKEACLRRQDCFRGKKYFHLPLLLSAENGFKSVYEVCCFSQTEKLKNPKRIHRLLGLSKSLFIPPVSAKLEKYDIETIQNVYDLLFKIAITNEKDTEEILCLLDSVDYDYKESRIRQYAPLRLTTCIIEAIMRHNRLAACLQRIGREAIRYNNKIPFLFTPAPSTKLSDTEFREYDISDTPSAVEKYLYYSGQRCICLDIEKNQYLPCDNCIVLSAENVMSSIAELCSDIDSQATLAIRIKLNEASKQLDQCTNDESCTAQEYLKLLQAVRLYVKDSLGGNGYRRYIQLIQQSGTDRNRFLQELLQNADDCEYAEGVIPSFRLQAEGSMVSTISNERGFTRANVRSITAIGESTKNSIINSDYESIGKKGIGFKSIFAVASEVRIHSGQYHFTLRDAEPTIPRFKETDVQKGDTPGTQMHIVLKDKAFQPKLDEKTILELCLCLRHLRSVQIGSMAVQIEDDDEKRTVVVNKRKYEFEKVIHEFEVDDPIAIYERAESGRDVEGTQRIVCYVPKGNTIKEFYLYTGLPTKHKINIPLVIDAPFELITSRELINEEMDHWNAIVRREMYASIVDVVDKLKDKETYSVLRFIRFVLRMHGNMQVYQNDISDSDYLIKFPFSEALRSKKILPSYEEGVFIAPNDESTSWFPEAANILFNMHTGPDYGSIMPAKVINVPHGKFDSAMKALGVHQASFYDISKILFTNAGKYIGNEMFRNELYTYLIDWHAAIELYHVQEDVRNLPIIPVYGTVENTVEYISWKEDSVFVKPDAYVSTGQYYVLDEEILSKHDCELIFDVNINEMNEAWIEQRYNKQLRARILELSDNLGENYRYLLGEYRSGRLEKYDAIGTICSLHNDISLLSDGNYYIRPAISRLFIPEEDDSFTSTIIKYITVHKECVGLADYLGCNKLRGIHYTDIDDSSKRTLTADDIEEFSEDYFENWEDILRGFYREGYLSIELLTQYELEYIAVERNIENSWIYDFPEDPVENMQVLRMHIGKLCKNPIRIISQKVIRTVSKGQRESGEIFDLAVEDARIGALRTYSPEGTNKLCFCQMCKEIKPYMLIEVNSIDLKPENYFPQMRVALCLECSKHFEAFRRNEKLRKDFIRALKDTDVEDAGSVSIPIGTESITFTGKHLAEIQEILRRTQED